MFIALNVKCYVNQFCFIIAFYPFEKHLHRLTHRLPESKKYMSNKVMSVRVGPLGGKKNRERGQKQLLGNSQPHLYFIGSAIKQAFPLSCAEIVIELNESVAKRLNKDTFPLSGDKTL